MVVIRDGHNEVAPWIVGLSCGFGSGSMTVPPRYADTSPAYGTALGSDAVMIEITWREVS
jgi:hypothetical protein